MTENLQVVCTGRGTRVFRGGYGATSRQMGVELLFAVLRDRVAGRWGEQNRNVSLILGSGKQEEVCVRNISVNNPLPLNEEGHYHMTKAWRQLHFPLPVISICLPGRRN
ncbi:Hypothetical predicted protein [Podarcis lilfordi]|uniref:Uncharacterized protein n=1 Tax=Podarcis lilfordi TaxID=74358 RepID=A0AA35K8R5_9SAUR|nr:Hypothetical predicted protein [Podarcis lilfordi]